MLIQALIMSKTDYYNALLSGTPDYQIRKVKTLAEMGCRIIFNLRKFNQVTSQLQQTHWLCKWMFLILFGIILHQLVFY